MTSLSDGLGPQKDPNSGRTRVESGPAGTHRPTTRRGSAIGASGGPRPETARQPDALTFDTTGKVAAEPLLEVEGIEDGRRVTDRSPDLSRCPDEHGQRFGEQRVSWASH